MTNHTPGPWTPEPCPCGHINCRTWMVSPVVYSQGLAMTQGDAQLIASAPDLLLTLELLVLNYHDEGRAIQPGSPIWEAIHAAIAQAKGV